MASTKKIIDLDLLTYYDDKMKEYINDKNYVSQPVLDNFYNKTNIKEDSEIKIVLNNTPYVFQEDTVDDAVYLGLNRKMGFRLNESLSRIPLKNVPTGSIIQIKDGASESSTYSYIKSRTISPFYKSDSDTQVSGCYYIKERENDLYIDKINNIKAKIDKAQNIIIESPKWDEPIEILPKGLGTKNNPYLVYSGEELYWFTKNVNILTSPIYINIEADINLNGYNFKPIVLSQKTIVLEGNNHIIYNFYTDGSGLFKSAGENSKFLNIIFINAKIYNNNGLNTGLFVDYLPQSKNVEFTNCHIDKTSIISGTGNHVGGFVGIAQSQGDGTLSFVNCSNEATVHNKGTNSSQLGSAGGFLSSIKNINISFNNCLNTGNISSGSFGLDGRVGGFIGFITNSSTMSNSFNYCYNFGLLSTSNGSSAGDFVSGIRISAGNYNAFSGALNNCIAISNPQDFNNIQNYIQTVKDIFKSKEENSLKLLSGAIPDYSWFFFDDKLVQKGDSAANPYIISTPEMLLGFQLLTNGMYDISSSMGQYLINNGLVSYFNEKPVVYFDNKYFIQTANFDLSEYGHFSPISSEGLWTRLYERIYYNGLHHYVKGLTQIPPVDGQNIRTCGGLFGYIGRKGGEIQNLKIIGANIQATADAGALLACGGEGIKIINCSVDKTSVIESKGYRVVDGIKYHLGAATGGLIGYINGTHGFFGAKYEVWPITIKNCSSEAVVISTSKAGGVVGVVQAPKSFILENCYFNGLLIVNDEVDGDTSMGGIIAEVKTEKAVDMENSFEVFPGDEELRASIVLNCCFNIGAMIQFTSEQNYSSQYTGGIVSRLLAFGIDNLPSDITLTNCYDISTKYVVNYNNIFGGIVSQIVEDQGQYVSLKKFIECITCENKISYDYNSSIPKLELEDCFNEQKSLASEISFDIYYGIVPARKSMSRIGVELGLASDGSSFLNESECSCTKDYALLSSSYTYSAQEQKTGNIEVSPGKISLSVYDNLAGADNNYSYDISLSSEGALINGSKVVTEASLAVLIEELYPIAEGSSF